MTTPVGWYVRVWVGKAESDDPAYETALYIAGYPTAAEAEAAVRRARTGSGERMEVQKGKSTPVSVPNPSPAKCSGLGARYEKSN
jgi:hypothetical protein